MNVDEAAEDARVDAVLAGVRNAERVDHRGVLVEVHAVPETSIALLHAEAMLRARERFGAEGIDADERTVSELATRMLERAMLVEACRTGDGDPLFCKVADVEQIEANELASLVEALRLACERAGVFVGPDDEELSDMVARVAKRRTIDHLRARHSDLRGFYGLHSAREASSLQVIYFSHCHRGAT